MGDTSATSGPNPSRESIVPPAKVSEHHRRGYIVPVGGAEDKDGNPTVLRRFVEVSGGEQARIAVIPTASRLEDSAIFDEVKPDVMDFANEGVRM